MILGSTLRLRREAAGFTQVALARRVGISQATIARIERGDRAPGISVLEQLFAALDLQLTINVEPLDAHVDARIAELSSRSIAERIEDTYLHSAMDRLGDFPYVLTGCTAALVQGAPVPAESTELMVRWRDADRFTDWLTKAWGQRWHARWQQFGHLPLDPREPGEHRWQTVVGEIRASMVDELPESIEIRHGERTYRVIPLALVEVTDPDAASLLRRHRDRQAKAAVPTEPA
jgi:transcriptional regulator with XRE-family HTH domain